MKWFLTSAIYGIFLIGCSSIPYHRLFSGNIEYQLSEEVEIIEVRTNYPDRESVVVLGFKAGLKDGMDNSYSLVHFDRGYEVNEKFYLIGYQWGRHIGSERRNQNLPSIVTGTTSKTEWNHEFY